MEVMSTHLYKALIEAGTSEQAAIAASEDVAMPEDRFSRIESDVSVLKSNSSHLIFLTRAIFVGIVGIYVGIFGGFIKSFF